MDAIRNGVAQLTDGKAGVPQEQPQTAGALRNNIWLIPSFLLFFKNYFLLKPQNPVALAGGTSHLPDGEDAIPTAGLGLCRCKHLSALGKLWPWGKAQFIPLPEPPAGRGFGEQQSCFL